MQIQKQDWEDKMSLVSSIVTNAGVYSGALYATILTLFRHSVLEDNGVLPSVNDLLPFALMLSADFYLRNKLSRDSQQYKVSFW